MRLLLTFGAGIAISIVAPSELHGQECFEDSVVVQMAKDLQAYDLLKEKVEVLEELADLERSRADQAEEGEKRAIEIAEQFRDLNKPSFIDTFTKVGVGVAIGVLLMEFARD